MKISDLLSSAVQTEIFSVVSSKDKDPLQWQIAATEHKLIPYEEGHFIVKAKQVSKTHILGCYMDISVPERISSWVFKLSNEKKTAEHFHKQKVSVIPAIASECYGNYELYYAKENPQAGIDVLKKGLALSKTKNAVAEDLGYIFRDEKHIGEAIETFLISEKYGPSSEFIYSELAVLYLEMGNQEKQEEYNKKYLDNGGIDMSDFMP